MSATIVSRSASVTVVDHRRRAGPHDRPFTEVPATHSVSYVRRGTFGLRYRGAQHDLVAGAVMTGCAGDEFRCIHKHHACGDECLSFQLSAEFLDTLGGRSAISIDESNFVRSFDRAAGAARVRCTCFQPTAA